MAIRIRQIHDKMTNSYICNKNHTGGKDEIRLSSTALTPFALIPAIFLTRLRALDTSYIHKASRSVSPHSSHTLNTPRISSVG